MVGTSRTGAGSGSLPVGLGDDLLGHVLGHFGVRVELHRVARPTGDLEGQLGRVDVVVLAVLQGHLDVDQRVAREDTELHGLLRPGVHAGDVLPRHAATGDLVDELVATAAVLATAGRLDVDDDPGV